MLTAAVCAARGLISISVPTWQPSYLLSRSGAELFLATNTLASQLNQ